MVGWLVWFGLVWFGLFGCLVGWLVGWLVDLLLGWFFVGRLLVGLLLVGRFFVWVGCLVWLVGLVGLVARFGWLSSVADRFRAGRVAWSCCAEGVEAVLRGSVFGWLELGSAVVG